MKPHCIPALALLFVLSGSLQADEGNALDLTTTTGKTYSHCQILKMYPDGVAFRHARGMAKVLFTDLTPEWRQHFGYDAEKVKAYERKVKEDNLRARETAAAKAAEARQAWVEANAAAEQAQALMLGMPYGEGYQPAPYYGYNDFGLTNSLGWGNQGSHGFPFRRGTGLRDANGRFFNERSSPITVPTDGRLRGSLVPVRGITGFNSPNTSRPWVAPRASHGSATVKSK